MIASLGAVGDAEVAPDLVAALSDASARVAQAAATALGELGWPQAVEPLIGVLGDERALVREAAAAALEQLDESLGRLLVEALDGSPEALATLGAGGDRCRAPGSVSDSPRLAFGISPALRRPLEPALTSG